MLDKSNNNPGYVLGWFFAKLDAIQKEAAGEGFAQSDLTAASSSPGTTFPRLIESVKETVTSAGNPALQTELARLTADILGRLPQRAIPDYITLQDQFRFMVGMSHGKA